MRNSTIIGMAALVLAALPAPARTAPPEQQVTVSGQSGISVPVVYAPADRAWASAILFVGGDGKLADEQVSFLFRVRGAFVAAGINVAVPDTPSDHPGGFGPLFRTWTANQQDIEAIVAFLKSKSPLPVWAVGTSNGTISAASGAAALGPGAIAGLVLTSAVWLGGLQQVPVETIAVPVLEIQNRDDQCPAANPAIAQKSMARFREAPDKRFIAVAGGGAGGAPCGTGSPHDLWGVENEVVPPIIAFMRPHATIGTAQDGGGGGESP